MLLLEWDNWWEQIPVLDAEAQFAAYTIGVMVHPDWKLEREDILSRWRDIISRAKRRVSEAVGVEVPDWQKPDTSPGALRRTAMSVRNWFATNMAGGGPNSGHVGWEARPPDDPGEREPPG